MKVEATAIPEVLILEPQIFGDARGFFFESFNQRRWEAGTEFQKHVWKILTEIPYGKSLSYSDIAKKINKNGAARAVGQAVGKNPIIIIIPCHRVLAKHGLGGFSAGLDVKKKLLDIENIVF